MPELIVAPAARADLLAQWDFYADDISRPDLGDRFFVCAEVTLKRLARSAGLGRMRTFRSAKAKGLRSWPVEKFPKHLIFYRPLSGERGVEIVRVLHGARDLEAAFKE